MRVLVVDDFATMRKIVKNVLRQINLENTVEAENGKQALELLKKEEVDLIISSFCEGIGDTTMMHRGKRCKGKRRIEGNLIHGDTLMFDG